MIALLFGAAHAVAPAVALAHCRPASGTTWTCGEVTLGEHPIPAPGPALAKSERPDGASVRLVALSGNDHFAAAWSEGGRERVVEGWGPRAAVEAALFEYAARGGVGGGPLRVGGAVIDLPLGCWIPKEAAVCPDRSSVAIVSAAAPPTASDVALERSTLGRVPCIAGGRPASCRVDALGRALVVVATNGDRELHCTPGDDPSGGIACAGLRWDPAAIEALVPSPATAGCALGLDGIWRCKGARVITKPYDTRLDLARDLPPGRIDGTWISTVDGVFRGCEGPDVVCSRVFRDWAAHPPGVRSTDLFGQPLAVPAGCDVAKERGTTSLVCETGVGVAWGPRLVPKDPAARPQSCKMLGLRATCVPAPEGGVLATLEDVPGTVQCRPAWCATLGL